MNAQEILQYAKKIDIRLSARGSKLIVDAPKGQLTDSLKSELKANKPALLKLLSKSSQPKKAIIYTALVDGKELTLIDITSKPFEEFRKGVISRFGAHRVGMISKC
jgi:hypothetical protein